MSFNFENLYIESEITLPFWIT